MGSMGGGLTSLIHFLFIFSDLKKKCTISICVFQKYPFNLASKVDNIHIYTVPNNFKCFHTYNLFMSLLLFVFCLHGFKICQGIMHVFWLQKKIALIY